MMPTPRHRQRGAATLAIALMLLVAMLLVVLAAHRNLLIELRQSANQAEATVAFEAAEAGLEWASAMLNTSERLGSDCRPSPLASESFRELHLDTALAEFTPRELRPACVHDADGWHCSCPGDAPAEPVVADDAVRSPAFALRLSAGPRPGVLRLAATGCNRWAGDCRPDGSGDSATARSEALIALQPALPAPPATALTLRPAGVEAEAFFAAHFGVSKAMWTRQDAVHVLDCRGDCGAALAVLAAQGVTLVAAPGDLQLRGPLALGTPQRPMLIVARGAIQLHGNVSLHGVLYGASLGWTAPAATVRGALISEGTAAGDDSLDAARDAAVLEALRTRQGSFVRLPGGWRDF